MDAVKELSTEEMLELLCAPEATDELDADELEQASNDDAANEHFIRRWIQEGTEEQENV